MKRESKTEIDRLRSQARRLDLTIRTQRGSRANGSRAYDLIDRTTGTVVHADVHGLADLQSQLWWIARDRLRAVAGQPPVDDLPQQLCPSCGTPRVAFFRSCLKCGLDYEASHEPGREVSSAPPDTVSARGTGGLPPAPSRIQYPTPTREPLLARLAWFRYAVAYRYFDSARELAVGAILGLLVGAIVAVALGGIR